MPRGSGNLAVNDSAPSINIYGNCVTTRLMAVATFIQARSDGDAFASDLFRTRPGWYTSTMLDGITHCRVCNGALPECGRA
jgi:hypothetical protein